MGKSQNTKTSLLNSRRKQQNSTLEISLRQSRRKSSPWTKKRLQRKRSLIGLWEQRRVKEEQSLQVKIHLLKLRLIKTMLIIFVQDGFCSLWNERPPQKWPLIFPYCAKNNEIS